MEAQAAAALSHPNIVSIFHVGQYDGAPNIVTESLHGETLRARLRHRLMRVGEAIDVGVDIARGLAAAHAAVWQFQLWGRVCAILQTVHCQLTIG